MTIPFYLYGGYSNFRPRVTFAFSVKAGDKDYTGSLTIPQIDDWNPYGKLFTATIELTEVLSAEYIWKSDITASESVEGEGTEASPYLIHSAKDLQWMIDQVNTNGVTGKYYRLTHDLEIDSEEEATWTPIGTADNPFVGNFDGGGCTISGEMHTTTDLVGFFGYNAGSISNLKNTAEVKDCRTESPMSNEYSAIGSIAGYSTGKIINCENSGNVTAANITTTTYTGGICGYQYGERNAVIAECKNSAMITGIDGNLNATGGIVGCAVGNHVEQQYYSAIISACENAGSVTNGEFRGGICGCVSICVDFVACLNTGDAGKGGILGKATTGTTAGTLWGCCTSKGSIVDILGSSVDICGCYTFDQVYEDESEDYYVDLTDSERVAGIVGPWDEHSHYGFEMNYGVGWANESWIGEIYLCNWHWEVGENNIPKLVEGAATADFGA